MQNPLSEFVQQKPLEQQLGIEGANQEATSCRRNLQHTQTRRKSKIWMFSLISPLHNAQFNLNTSSLRHVFEENPANTFDNLVRCGSLGCPGQLEACGQEQTYSKGSEGESCSSP